MLAKGVGRVNKQRQPVTTGGDGRFEITGLEAGGYQLRVTSDAYLEHTSHEVRVGSEIVPDELEINLDPGLEVDGPTVLEREENIRVRLVNGLTGETVSGSVVARDMAGNVFDRDEPIRDGYGVLLRIPPGQYMVSASAEGLTTTTVPAYAPGEVSFQLYPGGTMIIRSTEVLPRAARLLIPSGEEYVRCWCDTIEELKIEGAETVIDRIAAGSYTLVVTELDGSSSSHTVTVSEGREAELKVR